MYKAIKKNQLIIFAIAFMLVTAGYLSYNMKNKETFNTWATVENGQIAGIGDARLVSSNTLVDNDDNCEEEVNNKLNSSNTVNSNSVEENSINTSANVNDANNYFSESKLERDKMYSERLETYQTLISQTNISSEQRSSYQTEISKITDEKNAIMIAENLIKNKGFDDVVIFVNNGSVSVVVKTDTLQEAGIAQIQSIIQRELSCDVQDIHISNK